MGYWSPLSERYGRYLLRRVPFRFKIGDRVILASREMVWRESPMRGRVTLVRSNEYIVKAVFPDVGTWTVPHSGWRQAFRLDPDDTDLVLRWLTQDD